MRSFTPLEIIKSNRKYKESKSLTGFTLIETLVTIFILALIIGVVFGLIVFLYRTHGYAWEESQAIEEARRGIEAMTKEIREARTGEDGSYPLEKAEDKQIVFYSDIDNDGRTEKVRYFLGTVNSGILIQECQTDSGGGTCSVAFSNFFTGILKSAQLKVSVEGDLDRSAEYVTVSVDGNNLGNICQIGCSHCAGVWQGTTIYDVISQAQDNEIQFSADASSAVGYECPVGSPNHSMKARFEFSWEEEIIGAGNELKKGIIEPTGSPIEYPSEQENISLLTSYVRNAPPIFEYFDNQGDKIEEYPARLIDTKIMKVYLVVNVNPNRPPDNHELESYVQLRNLKEE